MDSLTGPAMLLVAGRAVGVAASFAVGMVFARMFDQSDVGTYKHFFLVWGTLFGLAQLGMAESLYYFVPRAGAEDTSRATQGRYIANAMATLTLAGAACLALLYAFREPLAASLSNPGFARYAALLGLYLTFTLVSAVLEIVLISRKRHTYAALAYALSDIGRTALFIAPALLFASMQSVFIGAVAFAAVRLAITLALVARHYGRDLRIDLPLWRRQLGYALPFAVAVGVEVLQINYHSYVVAGSVAPATFAIYAFGCLQIPLVDAVVTSTTSVLMVKMRDEASHGRAALVLWHETVARLAFLLVPLAVFLVAAAEDVIVGAYTETYAASVPIFRVWALTVLPSILAVDAVLRVYAQTPFLLGMNIARLAIVAVGIGWCLSAFGLVGAVLVTLAATSLVKIVAAVHITRLMHVRVWEALPWARLAVTTGISLVAVVPVLWLRASVALPPVAMLFTGAALYGAVYFAITLGPMGLRRLRALGVVRPVVPVGE